MGRRIREAAMQPVSSASVAFLRIAFGVAMVVNVALYLPGHVHEYYVDTTVHFPYGPFDFVRPLPGIGIYAVYVAMAGTGLLIALGKWYRAAAATFFVLTTYVFLLDSTYFQNHEYLISLLALLLTVLPVHRRWSLDARARPELRSETVPAWVVWLLRFQIGVPYFFGGIAKLNGDWLQGEPLRRWLAARADAPLVGGLLTQESTVWFMTYGSLVFDLAIVGFLLHRRTRLGAFVVAVAFHLLNARLWGLWIFPWLMIASTTIFFAPSWPERWLGTRTASVPRTRPVRGAVLSPLLVTLLAVWVAIQVAVPLRHLVVPGSPSWTEQGHRFAWHMKLRDKAGTVTYVLSDGDRTWRIDPAADLRPKQLQRLAGHPERLVHLARYYSEQHGGVEVRAETAVSLNGRRPQPIVDPTVDLSTVRFRWRGNDWILPLEEPLLR